MSMADIKKNPFMLRLLSGLVIGPFILAAILLEYAPLFMLLGVAIALLASHEWGRMFLGKDHKVLRALFCVLVLVSALAAFWFPLMDMLVFVLFIGFLLFSLAKLLNVPHAFYFVWGLVYLYIGLGSVETVYQQLDGAFWTLTLIVSVWCADTAAYMIGKKYGRKKLLPNISPNKTYAGLYGSMLGYAFSLTTLALLAPLFDVERQTYLVVYPFIGVVLGALGQAGDLYISQIKRKHDLKDTGNLIPGHGGILDRIDSLLLVAPVFLLLHSYHIIY